MALPVTISGVATGPNLTKWSGGPYKSSGGSYYAVLVDSTTTSKLAVVKATDPTSSFSIQDATNAPNVGAAPYSVWVFPDGDDLKICTAAAADAEYRYHVFHMATDLWDGTLKNETVENVKDRPHAGALFCSVVVRSDDDVVVLYNGDVDAVMAANYNRVDYAVRVTSWTVGANVACDGLESNWEAGAAVLGASDKSHFSYINRTASDVYHRSLSSADALGTEHLVDATAGSFVLQSVYYDAAGTERITLFYFESGNALYSSTIENDGTPATPVAASDVAVSTNRTHVVAENGTVKKVHLLYADSATIDLWYDSNTNDGGWGTDTEELDAVTINRISSNVYNRSGTKLAYVYDDGGTVKYNEVDLGGAPAATQTGWVQSRGGWW